ncbi:MULTISPECIES: ABC transporter permease [unclassified Chelatococcus]|uniref:ABC transporter permease n=1 Tax=unclassified Chelatococcus TaxID=2638111 RepID=UPI001BCCFAA5|nr:MULTISPECIES: ABC transporter permease [unclassified Chelatococcus]CAH1658447.1 putative spermidine/putrescine transport system permease protein [Hyphomicrobiales bacterium]MBS7740803.1 ABC transporter permease [Chelatococcus sp. HY11]MBX3545963.1 ABC transporter permease [Chelatococcus sp.]MCO5079589.1 ABC transporter permease [Chelatococcus sp.]CAH1684138.1 putative spermidine/putrescine transport system permease protein [Hyphomicrobiales bacterium]
MAEAVSLRVDWPRLVLYSAMLAPLFIILLFFFVVPLGIVAGNSLTGTGVDAAFPSLSQYTSIVTDSYYLGILWRTVVVGLAATLGALVLGYPAALVLFFFQGRWRQVFLFVIISPLFISVIVRTYGWMVLLGPGGLPSLLPSEIRPRLIKTEFAIMVGLAHIYIPYMVLSINSAMSRIDVRYLRAAATLRASNYQIFRDIILPLSAPGVVAGCAIVFSLSMTSFSTPILLGGSGNKTMPYLIYQQNLVVGDWATGSALAIVLLAVTMSVLVTLTLLSRRVMTRVGG